MNLFALALMTSGLFFLDSYRARLITERQNEALNHTVLLRECVGICQSADRSKLIQQFGTQTNSRVRLYSSYGKKTLDSFATGKPAYVLQDLNSQPWQKIAALQLDRAVDFLVGSAKLSPFREPAKEVATAWPEIKSATAIKPTGRIGHTNDFTHLISTATKAHDGSFSLLVTTNPRDVRTLVRAQRFSIFMFIVAGAGYFGADVAVSGAYHRAADPASGTGGGEGSTGALARNHRSAPSRAVAMRLACWPVPCRT